MKDIKSILLVLASLVFVAGCARRAAPDFQPLFSGDGEPQGWVVRNWAEGSEPTPEPVHWLVRDGVLHGGEPRGSWLLSER